MNYLQTIAYIDSLSPTLERPSLERLKLFMSERGDLQNRIPCFHVGGTNGKGSTVAILESILRMTGCKTARFTGPHLLRWNERFHIAGKPIADDEFAEVATRVRLQSEEFGKRHPEFGPLTWFEFLSAIAFEKFLDERIDVAIYEVGLGGRFDATNVVSNVLASVITNVSLDHTHLLGGTVEEIAREKSGIIKQGVPVVTAAEGRALSQIVARASEVGARLTVCALDHEEENQILLERTVEQVERIELSSLPRTAEFISRHLSLAGDHQKLNAFVALAAILKSGWFKRSNGSIDLDLLNDLSGMSEVLQGQIGQGLESVKWAGRLQYIPETNMVLDGAHNSAGAAALRQALDSKFPNCRKRFVVSCFGNKNATDMLSSMLRGDDLVFVAEAAARRQSHSGEYLASIARQLGAEARVCQSVEAALELALEGKGPDRLVVVAGSFAAIREAMLYLGFKDVEDSFKVKSLPPECLMHAVRGSVDNQ